MTKPIVAIVGAGGDLGGRITKALVARGATVRALIRHDARVADEAIIASQGAEIIRADVANSDSLASVLKGADVVLSALNGLHDTIVDRQRVLLNAAVKAGVRRFISSDY